MAAPPDAVPSRPHRRWPRRLLIGLNIFVAICIVGVGSGYAYLRWRFNQIDTIDFGPGTGGADVLADDASGAPMNVLLVGSDTRENLTGADCKRNCVDENGRRVTGKRSDTIMVLHADPKEKRAAILSIPRDLWVPIAGTAHRGRINTAYSLPEGEEKLVETVHDALGIDINHFVSVDFVGFKKLVNVVDGVQIYVPAPARDRYSDLAIPKAGCIKLTGDQALSWVRSRHYQYFEAGRWRSDPSSDFGRILRQQDFIRRLMKKAISKGVRNPLTLNRLLGAAVNAVRIDNEMSTKDILSLGRRFRSLDPESVQMVTLPTVGARIGGADVLRIKQPEAQQVIDTFLGTTPDAGQPATVPNVPPESVRVRTLNGSGVGGAASKTAAQLGTFGFQSVGTGDADNFAYQQTVIRYGRGALDKARLLQAYVRSGARLVADSTLTVDVVLVVGRDYTGLARPAVGGAPTTVPPTTVAPQSPVPVPKGAPPQPQC